MPRMYRVPINLSLAAASGDIDLLTVLPADDKPVRLVGWILGQISEVGDAQMEGLRVTVRHMTATVTNGTGGSTPTPQPNRPGFDVAAGFTARVNDTGVATTSGTSVILEELSWIIQNTPWERWIPEELRPRAAQGEALIVRLETTVGSTITAPSTFFVEEEG